MPNLSSLRAVSHHLCGKAGPRPAFPRRRAPWRAHRRRAPRVPPGNVAGVTESPAPAEPTVRTHVDGAAGRITLNRPRALNALDTGMIRHISAALGAWRHDPDVDIVVLDGAGERGLCA